MFIITIFYFLCQPGLRTLNSCLEKFYFPQNLLETKVECKGIFVLSAVQANIVQLQQLHK